MFRDHRNIVPLGRFGKDSMIAPVVFSCFDNMEARKLMFEKWCEQDDKQIFIDGRMLAEQGMVYAVTPDKIERYKETLFDDSEVEDQDCSYKATTHCGKLISSLMTAVMNNYVANEIVTGMPIREVPFEINFNLQLLDICSTT
jgi:molybdopterin/thiamine biosynthesis adenylyltransferase